MLAGGTAGMGNQVGQGTMAGPVIVVVALITAAHPGEGAMAAGNTINSNHNNGINHSSTTGTNNISSSSPTSAKIVVRRLVHRGGGNRAGTLLKGGVTEARHASTVTTSRQLVQGQASPHRRIPTSNQQPESSNSSKISNNTDSHNSTVRWGGHRRQAEAR